MDTLATSLFWLTALAYLLAAALLGWKLLRSGAWARAERFGMWSLALGGVLHFAHIVAWSVAQKACPAEGVYFPLSLGANLMVLLLFALRKKLPSAALGTVIAPLALTALLAARFASEVTAPPPSVRSALLPFHITANLLGIALFSLASAAALLYLVQERRLKSKKLGHISRLPPLDALDRSAHWALSLGFPLLTVGVVTGSLFLDQLTDDTTGSALRAGLGYLTWVLIASVLLLRQAAGWRGRRAAFGTIAGFALCALVFTSYVARGLTFGGVS